MILEIVGYIGSALVVISMLMSSIVKLRVINTIGSIISGTYAVLCGAFPLALMNACLIAINLYNLWKLREQHVIFDLVTEDSSNGMVKYFLDSYQDDIRRFFPDYKADEKAGQAFLVCAKGAPVGVILGDVRDGALDIRIDYSTPAYRDCSVGRYLHSRLPEQGIHNLRFAQALSEGHEPYLRKMGYMKEGDQWLLNLS